MSVIQESLHQLTCGGLWRAEQKNKSIVMQKRRARQMLADFNVEDNSGESHEGLKEARAAYLKTKVASWPENGIIPEQEASGNIGEAPAWKTTVSTNASFLVSRVITHCYFTWTLISATESVH